jgi:hypothetical protein
VHTLPAKIRDHLSVIIIILVILQSFDWLAAFYLELLQAILFTVV